MFQAIVIAGSILAAVGFVLMCVWIARSESEANVQREKNEEEKWAQLRAAERLNSIQAKSRNHRPPRVPPISFNEVAIDLENFMRYQGASPPAYFNTGRMVDHNLLIADVWEKGIWAGTNGIDVQYKLDQKDGWLVYSLPDRNSTLMFKLAFGGITLDK